MQLGLSLNLIPDSRCLSSASLLRGHLRLTQDEVMVAIERGHIPFAFDLRMAAADRALVRIWHPTVLALVNSHGAQSGEEPPLEQVLARLVPQDDVHSSSLERWWGISHDHVHHLIAAGELPVRRRPLAAHGVNSFTLLACEGLRDFLRRRHGWLIQGKGDRSQEGLKAGDRSAEPGAANSEFETRNSKLPHGKATVA